MKTHQKFDLPLYTTAESIVSERVAHERKVLNIINNHGNAN